MKVKQAAFIALLAYSEGQGNLKPKGMWARCSGRLEKCKMYEKWNWDVCQCERRNICDKMVCPTGYSYDPTSRCACTVLKSQIPVKFKSEMDGMGQCGNDKYWSPEAEVCVSYEWCPKWDGCETGKSWDTNTCSCDSVGSGSSQNDQLDELSRQCGGGWDWNPSLGTCVESQANENEFDNTEIQVPVRIIKVRPGDDIDTVVVRPSPLPRPGNDVNTEIVTPSDDIDRFGPDGFVYDPDQDLSQYDNIQCPKKWSWNVEIGRCTPPGSTRNINVECTFNQDWDSILQKCINTRPDEDRNNNLVCPFGYEANSEGSQCNNKCAKGMRWVEREEENDRGQTEYIERCEWIDDVKCLMRRVCSLGRYQGLQDGKCKCLKIRGFQPEDKCGSTHKWNWRKWRCERKRVCQVRECSYGKKWVQNACSCIREDWCPANADDCSYGKYWHNAQCKCVRQSWCPERNMCNTERGERWDNRQCVCLEPETFTCPTGMTWNGDKEECKYTRQGCMRAECPTNKQGTWTNNECRCKYKKDFCSQLECPLGKRAEFTVIGCSCQRIPNFRPATPGMCGPGKRWSIKKFSCRPFKGCGPGRSWSNEQWKCVGTLTCPAGTKWAGRLGKCLPYQRKCLMQLPCPLNHVWDKSKCQCKRIMFTAANTNANCPVNYICKSPLMRWDHRQCKCVPGLTDSLRMRCPLAQQRRHIITKMCVCINKQTCPWQQTWSNANCKCEVNQKDLIKRQRRRAIRTAQMELLRKIRVTQKLRRP